MLRGYDTKELEKVIEILHKEEKLPEIYKDHKLNDSNKYHNARECHIKPDWLLVYKVIDDELILELVATGSHSYLFD